MKLLSIEKQHPGNYRLDCTRVDIWHFSLESHAENALHWLDEDELKRAHRFCFPRHRRRFIAAHAAMRQILSRYLHTKAADIQFCRLAKGKPAIECQLNLEFNLSHSGEMGVLAVGKEHAVGMDIEIFSQRPYYGLADHMFSADECKRLKKVPTPLLPGTFFTIWAQKEAFIKACGLGLSYPTKEFSVPSTLGEQLVWDKLHQQQWCVHSYMAKVGYSAAICINPAVTQIHKIYLDNNHKLESL